MRRERRAPGVSVIVHDVVLCFSTVMTIMVAMLVSAIATVACWCNCLLQNAFAVIIAIALVVVTMVIVMMLAIVQLSTIQVTLL